MTASILHFTPRAELEPTENVDAFIDLCRQSEVLKAHIQFAKNVWDCGEFKGHNKVHRAVFSNLEASSTSDPEPCLAEPFLSFAKAVLVYFQDQRPVTSQGPRIMALRCIEASLREHNKGCRPTAVDGPALDTAVELARQQVFASVAYRVAGQIEAIADFMRSKQFIFLRGKWLHGVPKPQEHGSRIAPDALKARQEKLPSAEALGAIGAIFQEATSVPDVLVSSFLALMLCAPERINEPLRLVRNSLVEEDGKIGMRWPGSKGFEDGVKWFPTLMGPLAQDAMTNILRVTVPAQALAAWYTENPTKLYLHEDAKHLRDVKVLTLEQVAFILWGKENLRSAANNFSSIQKKLPKQPLGGRTIGYRFEDIERAVISMLPQTFPYVAGSPDLKCKDSVVCVRTNEMHSDKATYLCMFETFDYNVITNPLGAREGRGGNSIFERFNYTEADGTPIELKSHSLRHYINTLAQIGGLTSAQIAFFSGRKDERQNRHYNWRTSAEIQAPVTAALAGGFTSELELQSKGRERPLVTRSEFRKLGLGAGHTSDFGYCDHDFASEPCPQNRDCVNCDEHECIKGDAEKEAGLRLRRSETAFFLNQARAALRDEEYNADTWVAHYTKSLARMDALIGILDDPKVREGARIRLASNNVPLITEAGVQSIQFHSKESMRLA
ncbi:MAG: hypothetical protein NVSMB57_07760 [Actinomycetota bacterium]